MNFQIMSQQNVQPIRMG